MHASIYKTIYSTKISQNTKIFSKKFMKKSIETRTTRYGSRCPALSFAIRQVSGVFSLFSCIFYLLCIKTLYSPFSCRFSFARHYHAGQSRARVKCTASPPLSEPALRHDLVFVKTKPHIHKKEQIRKISKIQKGGRFT